MILHESVSCSFLSNWIERKTITLAKSTTQLSDQSCALLQWNFAIKGCFLYNIRIFQESDCLFLVYWLEFEIFMYNIWPIVNSKTYNLCCRRWNSWKWTVWPAKPAFNMSLKLPRKNAPKPFLGVLSWFCKLYVPYMTISTICVGIKIRENWQCALPSLLLTCHSNYLEKTRQSPLLLFRVDWGDILIAWLLHAKIWLQNVP